MNSRTILDPCCGGRMFWFDRDDPRAVFGDIRSEGHTLCDGRALEIRPDVRLDFARLPFDDGAFALVVFDPPHLPGAGANGWMAKKYGSLKAGWQDGIRQGFAECFRVLRPGGTLVFKWNETRIPIARILALTDQKPVVGHRTGSRAGTHWVLFLKQDGDNHD